MAFVVQGPTVIASIPATEVFGCASIATPGIYVAQLDLSLMAASASVTVLWRCNILANPVPLSSDTVVAAGVAARSLVTVPVFISESGRLIVTQTVGVAFNFTSQIVKL